MKTECSCEKCKSACAYKPGWFLPEELAPLAEFFNLSEKEVFDKYLAVDWFEGDEDIFLISPAILGSEGGMFPGNPTGTCVFYSKGLCEIHSVKPYECKAFMHGTEKGVLSHKEVGEAWKPFQEKVKELLGEEPETESYSLFDSLFGWR